MAKSPYAKYEKRPYHYRFRQMDRGVIKGQCSHHKDGKWYTHPQVYAVTYPNGYVAIFKVSICNICNTVTQGPHKIHRPPQAKPQRPSKQYRRAA